MISTLVFLTFGATLSALANHYILLLVARIICGYSGSVSAVAHCIYMAEVSEPNKRGYNIMLYQLGTATGFLVSVIAAAIKNIDYQWRFSIGITAVPALAACIITIIFLQRSPPFLLYKRMANVSKTSSKKAWYTIFETLTIMAFLLILQQGTGKRQVLYYAPRLFALLGICSSKFHTCFFPFLPILFRNFLYSFFLYSFHRCCRGHSFNIARHRKGVQYDAISGYSGKMWTSNSFDYIGNYLHDDNIIIILARYDR